MYSVDMFALNLNWTYLISGSRLNIAQQALIIALWYRLYLLS